MTVAAQRTITPVDPATLEPVGTVEVTPPEAIDEIVAEARLVQRRWASPPHAERRALLVRVAHVLLDSADELAGAITAETGKPVLEAYTAELFLALEQLRWTAANAERVIAGERVRFGAPYLRHKHGRLLYEPYGAVAVIAPWNFPFGIPFTQTIAAVAAGNAVVVKPSELAPLTGEWVQRAFEEAGAPAGLVRIVQGDGATGELLVRARGIAKVFFTGSTGVGRNVAAAAGERLCPVSLELGGKDAMLVFEDADLDRAVEGALWARSRTAARRARASSASTSRATSTSPSWKSSAGGPRGCGSAPEATSRPSSVRSSPSSSARRSSGSSPRRSREARAYDGRRPPGRRPAGMVLRADRARGSGRGRGARARGDLRPGRRSRGRSATSRRPSSSRTTPPSA